MTHHAAGAYVRGMTGRELEGDQHRLLELLASGRTVGEAAAALDLAPRTAERRLAAARAALGARTTAQAVALAAPAGSHRPASSLSGRELETLELVAHGLTSREIARLSGGSTWSVDALVRSAVAKLGARTRVEAAAKVGGIYR